MITNDQITTCQGSALFRGSSIIMLPPHLLLSPYISNYTITCPLGMDWEQSVMPTASTTLVYSIGASDIIGGLRGVNTVPCNIGGYAAQIPLLILVEFHPAGLYPFVRHNQHELLDRSVLFEDLSTVIDRQIKEALLRYNTITELTEALDDIFLSHLDPDRINDTLTFAMNEIIRNKGMIKGQELADLACYSERHLNRLFRQHIGTGIKTFSRIMRLKYVLDLLGDQAIPAAGILEQTGYYDPSHFVRDFREIVGMTPGEYRARMSVFYNDPFKLNGYNNQ